MKKKDIQRKNLIKLCSLRKGENINCKHYPFDDEKYKCLAYVAIIDKDLVIQGEQKREYLQSLREAFKNEYKSLNIDPGKYLKLG